MEKEQKKKKKVSKKNEGTKTSKSLKEKKEVSAKKTKIVEKPKVVKTKASKDDFVVKEEVIIENNTSFWSRITPETKKIAMGSLIGLLVGVLVMLIFWPERIAQLSNGEEVVVELKNGKITANKLYDDMKGFYNVSILLNTIDQLILEEKYPVNDSMQEEAESSANYYISSYEAYGYTKEQFLVANGFTSYEEFVSHLMLDIRRNMYYDKYLKESVTEKEINDFYKTDVYGDINCQHILVKSGSKPDEALALAKEIISKLNKGTSWEQVQKDYKDKITFEDLGYKSFNASLEESFMDALVALKENSYSKTPVETSYGYHIIYRFGQKEKPKLEDVKDDVIEKIASNKDSKDSTLYDKALIELREEYKINFFDTQFKSQYDAYVKDVNRKK